MTQSINHTYHNLLSKIMREGFEYEDPNRKGVMRKQITHYTIEHDFEKQGYPIIGLKQSYPKAALNEMLAFMLGENHIKDLWNRGIKFWDKDGFNYFKKQFPDVADKYSKEKWEAIISVFARHGYGNLGKIYPYQIRNWNGNVDQLNKVLQRLKKEPMSTKNIVTMWNPSDEEEMALTPCHTRFSFVVEKLKNEYGLRIQWNQDSVDFFLGLPMNIMYYADACYVFAKYLNMRPLGIIGNLTNVHIYDNAYEASKSLLEKDPNSIPIPRMYFNYEDKVPENIDEYLKSIDYKKHFTLENYSHLGKYDVPMLPYNK